MPQRSGRFRGRPGRSGDRLGDRCTGRPDRPAYLPAPAGLNALASGESDLGDLSGTED